ncbi:hypothetical protein B7802_07755 [Salmonella enterica]|nr:hypothetical protein [Salmonella enterica]EBI4324858.1 hypothetical protein [Salmonella enterica]
MKCKSPDWSYSPGLLFYGDKKTAIRRLWSISAQFLGRSVYFFMCTDFAHNGNITLYLKTDFMAVISGCMNGKNRGIHVIS